MSDSIHLEPNPPTQAPAGWYADGSSPDRQRWWSGDAWTAHTRPAPRSAPPANDQTAAGNADQVVATPAAPAQKRQPWLIPTVVAAAALAAVVSIGVLVSSVSSAVSVAQKRDEERVAAETAAAAETARLELLSDAVGGCRLPIGSLQDEGRSAFLDSEGKDYGSGNLTFSDVECVLNRLEVPDSVMNHMMQTRSLDGTQSDTWGDFDARWNYHPDDGLDVIIKLID